MVWAITSMLMGLLIKVSGKTTNNMDRELKPGQTERSTKANTMKERNMEKALFVLLTEASTRETFSTMKFVAKASTCGLMARLTKALGIRIRCTAMEF